MRWCWWVLLIFTLIVHISADIQLAHPGKTVVHSRNRGVLRLAGGAWPGESIETYARGTLSNAYVWCKGLWSRLRPSQGGASGGAGLARVGKRSALYGDSSAKRKKERDDVRPTEWDNVRPTDDVRPIEVDTLRGGRGNHGRRQAEKFRGSSGVVPLSNAGAAGGGVEPRAGPGPGEQAALEASKMTTDELLQEAKGITSMGGCLYNVEEGYAEGMKVPASFYASDSLLRLVLLELRSNEGRGGFLPAVTQLANVATLPGIVSSSIGMPDIHSGYGFAIGNVAAMNLDDPEAVVSPGGVGFDINCGVRLLRSNLKIEDVHKVKKELADTLFKTIPVGVGEGSILGRLTVEDLDEVLESGMKWAEKKGLIWKDDRENVEEGGCFDGADASCVTSRAKQRGRTQCGSLGSGNHYAEVQVVDEVYDEKAANAMGLSKGSICVMLHSGSRGLGHQVCTDALQEMERAMVEQNLQVVDRQLACCRIQSDPGQRYIKAMKCAANFAFVNRSLMAMGVRKAFEKVFGVSADKLGMSLVYDVSHNIAKEEVHKVDGKTMRVLVHRKGATRAFGPGHPEIPNKYREVGQPVLVGGSMGTCSYVLTGTQVAMDSTFGSTCHGAGRAMSRSQALRTLNSKDVLEKIEANGCTARVATRRLAAEEAPESYKDVSEVVQTCHDAGISRMCVRLRPIVCVKG